MRKKLAGIHLLAPLTESEVSNLGRNLDRELIINTTPVIDAVIDTHEKTNYIVSFEYDSTLDGGTNHIRRSIPTLELLGNSDANVSGTHWIQLEDKEYHYIDSDANAQLAFEQLDEQLTKVCYLKHIVDAQGNGSIVSSNDEKVPLSNVDDSAYAIILGQSHTVETSPYATILGGYSNNVIVSGYSNILNGHNNRIDQSSNSSIYGGQANIIEGDTSLIFIIHGMYNTINNATESGIIGGHNNYITGIEGNSYGTIITGSVYGYINGGEFATLHNTANSYIINGRYAGSNLSAYIEIKSSTAIDITASSFISALNVEYGSILASQLEDTYIKIGLYDTTNSVLQGTYNSIVWHSVNSAIIGGDENIIAHASMLKVDSVSKTVDTLTLYNVNGFTVGQTVFLTGAEFSSVTTEYLISYINTSTAQMKFVKPDGTALTFDTGISGTITVYSARDAQPNTNEIISNTTDTITIDDTDISATEVQKLNTYLTIDGMVTKYTILPVGNTATTDKFKLAVYGTTTLVTFTANALIGKVVRVYVDEAASVRNASIITSLKSRIYSANQCVILGSDESQIQYATLSSILSSDNSVMQYTNNMVIIGGSYNSAFELSSSAIICGYINYLRHSDNSTMLGGKNSELLESSQSSILGGCDHYVDYSDNSIIAGGYNNYLSNAGGSGIYTSTDSKIYSVAECVIIGSDNSYITEATRSLIIGAKDSHIQSSNNMILGGYNQYIEGSGNSVIIGGEANYLYSCGASAIIGSYGSTIHNCAGGVILGGYSNTVNGSNTGPYPDVSDGLVAMIACNNITAWRNNAVYMPSIALVESTFELRDKTPEVGNALVVESVMANVATLKWGEGGGGAPDMTPIPINGHSSALSDYNTNPKKIVYIFNSDILYEKTGSYRRDFQLISGGSIYPNGTIIYIILYHLADYDSSTNEHGIHIGTGGSDFYMSSNVKPDGTAGSYLCRTVAFQKVSDTEWLKFIV